jgi:hypothetical protein
MWFLLPGHDPDKLKKEFSVFFSNNAFPQGIALWKWKKTCWICSPEKFKQDILDTFLNYGIIEFSSAPSPSDLEFIHGDINSLNPLDTIKSPHR